MMWVCRSDPATGFPHYRIGIMNRDQTITVNDDLWMSPLTASDRERCVELLNDRDIERRMRTVPHPYGNSDFDGFLAIAEAAATEHGCPVHLGIRHRNQGLIGGVGYEGVVLGHRVELGYWLGKPFWGQGIMTSVVATMCVFAIRQWNVVRITAHVFDGNKASARVLEKNDFVCEGLLRKVIRKHDTFVDARLYAKIVI